MVISKSLRCRNEYVQTLTVLNDGMGELIVLLDEDLDSSRITPIRWMGLLDLQSEDPIRRLQVSI
jgi:hypothetical protein